MEYIKRRKRLLIQVRVFSDLNNMHLFLEHDMLDVLLLGENLHPLQGNDYSNIHTVVLTEENKGGKDMEVSSIYKYQPVGSLVDELITICPELKEEDVNGQSVTNLKIIPILSLGSGSVGEIFSYLLAKEYGNKDHVLFINLEPFTGLRETISAESQKGMSDVIYYVNEKVLNLKEKLELLIRHKDNIDLVPDITFSTDLYDFAADGMRILLNTIRECKKYKYCIINIGFVSSTVFELFAQSHKIYIVTGIEDVNCRRRDNFVKQLEWAGFEEILSKLEEVCLTDEEMKYIFRTYEVGAEDESIKEYMKSFI
jgi:hypothetical protein